LGRRDFGVVKLTINGEARDVEAAEDVAGLVAILGLPERATLIEHNGLALRHEEWPQRILQEGDRLEIIRIVAGG
jgi:sulfur carrier protein